MRDFFFDARLVFSPFGVASSFVSSSFSSWSTRWQHSRGTRILYESKTMNHRSTRRSPPKRYSKCMKIHRQFEFRLLIHRRIVETTEDRLQFPLLIASSDFLIPHVRLGCFTRLLRRRRLAQTNGNSNRRSRSRRTCCCSSSFNSSSDKCPCGTMNESVSLSLSMASESLKSSASDRSSSPSLHGSSHSPSESTL